MKTKKQKRVEAVTRAYDRYNTAHNFNWKYFLDKYPTLRSYLRQFDPEYWNEEKEMMR